MIIDIHKAENFKNFEEKFKILFDNAADPIFILDNKGKFIQINKKVKEKIGYKEKDLIGKKFTEMNILTKKSKLIALKNFIKRMAGFEIKPYEIEIIKKNGEIIIGEINASTIKEKGKPIGDMVIIRDITEKRKIEQALIESEQKYRLIFEEASDGILVADAKTRKFIFANPKICEIIGYPLKELLKLDVTRIHPKKDLPYVLDQFKKQIEGKISIAKDISILRKDKKIVFCDVNSKNIDLKGRKYIVGFFRDITERKKTEQIIKESEEKFRALVNNIPAIVMNVDQNGKIMFINYTLPELTIEKTIGKTIYDFIPPEYHDKVKKTIKQVFKTGKVSVYETMGAGPKGEMKYYSTIVGPIKQEKKVVSVILISSDITERKKAEEELRRSKGELQSKVEELEKFNKLTIGRELKMVELKRRIKELEYELGKKRK